MLSSVAGIGLRSSFPPTVILCFTSLAISPSTAPGLLTRQPPKSNRDPASKSCHAVGIGFSLGSLNQTAPKAFGSNRANPHCTRVRSRRFVTAGCGYFAWSDRSSSKRVFEEPYDRRFRITVELFDMWRRARPPALPATVFQGLAPLQTSAWHSLAGRFRPSLLR